MAFRDYLLFLQILDCVTQKTAGDEEQCTYMRDILESSRYSLLADVYI